MGIRKVLPLLYSPPQLHSQPLLQDTNPRNPTQPLNRVQNNPFRKQQTRLSVDRSVDRPYAPVDRSQPRVGSLQSVDRAVDRDPPAVDRTGRPRCCFCRRSTGPVNRATAAADFWNFFFVDSSTTSSPYTWYIHMFNSDFE